MSKIMKTFVFLFIICILGLSSCGEGDWYPTLSPDPIDYSNLTFVTSGNTATLSAIKDKNVEDIVIPENVRINNVTYKVDRIGDDAFYGCYSLRSITIPDSVLYIGDNAFRYCESLTDVSLGNNIVSIGMNNFYRYRDININYNEYEGGYYLGNNSNPYVAFIQTKEIDGTTIIMNDNCTCLEDTFISLYGCPFDEVEYDNAFYVGNSTNPYLILDHAIDKSITSCVINPNCKRISDGAFRGCESLVSVTLGSGVKYIGEFAFSSCFSLKSIIVPEGVIYMGDKAFERCHALETVVLPNSLTTINQYAFSYCLSLKSVKLGNKVTSLEEMAFGVCPSLEHITIPNSLTSLNETAIYRWDSMNYNEYDNAYYLGNSSNPYLILIRAKDTSITSCKINEKCRFIYNAAFMDCISLTTITIPSSVTTVGSNAFFRCVSLKNISIADSVSTIGWFAFSSTAIESIVIPNSVTTIGSEAFAGCYYLKTISIPSSLIYLNRDIFVECSSIQYNEYDNAYYLGNDENPYLVLIKAKDTSITSCNIHKQCKYILNNAFQDCASIKSVVIPDSVVNIGYAAFQNCVSLESIMLPFIGIMPDGYTYGFYSQLASIFGSKSGSQVVSEQDYPPNLKTITLGDACKVITSAAFMRCSTLVSITIPKDINVIHTSPFFYCDSFTEVYYRGSISDWNSVSKSSTWMNNITPVTVHCTDGDIVVSNNNSN